MRVERQRYALNLWAGIFLSWAVRSSHSGLFENKSFDAPPAKMVHQDTPGLLLEYEEETFGVFHITSGDPFVTRLRIS